MNEEEKKKDDATSSRPAETGEPPEASPDSQDPAPEDARPTGPGVEGEEEVSEDDREEEEFDLESQIEMFRQQIEEEPDHCVHHYNLGEALAESGNSEEALAEYDLALELDADKEFSGIIHFTKGELLYQKLISGIQGTVVRSSVGLHSQHKPGDSITQVSSEDYQVPIGQFESAIEHLDRLKADEDIVEYVRKNAPQRIADTYYKWASDLIDKSRQIEHYGDEIKDVKQSLQFLKKTLDLDPNHSQAQLMVKYAKKMLQEGWTAYDEYGFIAKEIQGTG